MGKRRLCAMLAGVAFLSACSFAPVYHAPRTALPTTFKEAGGWQAAQPADRIERDGWWKAFRDPALDKLEIQVAAANPDVAAAVARHDEASALFDQARSGLFPTLGLGAQISSNRASATRPLRGATQPSPTSTAPTRWMPASTTTSTCGARCATRWPRAAPTRRPPPTTWPRCA